MKNLILILLSTISIIMLSSCPNGLQSYTEPPTFSHGDGVYSENLNITIDCATTGADIYYTTDGGIPTTSSIKYTKPIEIAGHETRMTINAMAVADGYNPSNTVTAYYEIEYPTTFPPQFSPSPGTYNTDQDITISSQDGATIYYTTDGSTPTTSSIQYTEPITIAGDGTNMLIQAIAIADGYLTSEEAGGLFEIDYWTTDTPTFTPDGGTYSSDREVTIRSTTFGATIYYTVDGSTPTTESTEYTAPIPVAGHGTSMIIKAIAVKDGYSNSSIGSAVYNISYNKVSTPYFSPSAGKYSSDRSITINSYTSGAHIYYTTDGSTPTTASSVYTEAITVSGHETVMTINAIAVADGYLESDVGSATYEIDYYSASTPIFTPAGGTYSSDQNVTISSYTTNATIFYTTDGNTPTLSSSVYTGAISIAGHGTNTTLKAIAIADGYALSDVGSAEYNITYPAAATPSFSPAAGTYNSDQDVTISCNTSGATIFYTTDGSTPTAESTQYTGTISIAGHQTSITIKAIAITDGYTYSNTGSAEYVINYPAADTPVFSPSAGTYNSNQDVTISCNTSGATIFYTTDGSTPTTDSTQYTDTISIAGHGTNTTIKVIAVADGYTESTVGSAEYTITYLPADTPVFSPAAGTRYSDSDISISCDTSGATIFYTTDGSTPTISSTQYTEPIDVSGHDTSMSIKAIAVANGYLTSEVGNADYTYKVAPPQTYPGDYNTYYNEIEYFTFYAVSAANATIYYTTDGSTPTTSSTVFDGDPIYITEHESSLIFKAIGVAEGYQTSDINTDTYNYKTASPTMSAPSGTYNNNQTVELTSETVGAQIYYTTDGSAPTTSSALYSEPVTVSENMTLKAIATANGYEPSGESWKTYNFEVSEPSFNLESGNYNSDQELTISCDTESSTIYYTTDGSTPDTASNLYTGALELSGHLSDYSIKAIATKEGYLSSETISADYFIKYPAAFTEHVIEEQYAHYVEIIDIDGDGDLDVIGAGNILFWLENNGTESFTRHTIGMSPYYIKTTDLDSDGDADILAATSINHDLLWYENNGSGSFSEHTVTNTHYTSSVDAADWNGDGDIDIASSELIWWDNGAASQIFTNRYGIDETGYSDVDFIAAADFNGDGYVDVFAASSEYSTEEDVAIWTYDGTDYTRRYPSALTLIEDYKTFNIADINQDGKMNILGGGKSGTYNSIDYDGICWWEVSSFGSPSTHPVSNSDGNFCSVFAADIDIDGDIDILASESDSSDISWFENPGNNHFGTRQSINSSFTASISSIYAIDLDEDGDTDIIGATDDNNIIWWENSIVP